MPLAGAKVIAVACNLRKTDEIGQSQTGNQGHYRICCSAAAVGQQGSTAGDQTGSHDLQLKVLSQEGETLYTSEIHFHVTSGADIPIALGGSACREPSEFARLGIALGRHLSGLRLDIDFMLRQGWVFEGMIDDKPKWTYDQERAHEKIYQPQRWIRFTP